MKSKKINILVSSILGMVLTLGIMEVPALADSSVQTVSSYSSSDNSANNKSYIVSKDNDIEQNGLKISMDKIIATKHRLKVTVKVVSQKPFDKNADNNVTTLLTYGDSNESSSGASYNNVDDKTLIITLDKEVDKEEIPEKGNLRVDIVIPKYKINVGMDANVDFSEAFKDIIEKEVSVNVPEFNFTVKKIESNVLGTEVTYNKEEKNDSIEEESISHVPLLVKIGDKMYRTREERRDSSRDNNSDTLTIIGTYNAQAATCDKVKGQNSISIIPINCSMSDDERSKFYEDIYKNADKKKDDNNKDTTDGISYTKNFDFSDGTKGEIYKIEREDNNVKVYCKGATDKEGLLMASSMSLYPKIENEKIDYYNSYQSEKNMTFYKDPKDSLGYIVEFDNLDKNKDMELNFELIIKEIDKYKIGDEIQLSK